MDGEWQLSRFSDGWKMTKVHWEDIEVRDLNWFEKIIYWPRMYFGILILLLLFPAVGHAKEECRRVFSHNMLIPQRIGKMTTFIHIPQYQTVCDEV